MANVFGNGSTKSCFSGGDILPVPRPAVVPARSVSASPKVFKGGTSTSDQLNPLDFYTRRQIDRYLDDKANISDVYNKSDVDELVSQLNISSYASLFYVNSSVSTLTSSIATKLSLAGGQMTGNITFSGSQTVDGRDLSADGSKLDGIETGATADQTKSDIDALGINADQLDGQEGSYYRNAGNINSGTLAKSRLPSTMNGTTFTGDVTISKDDARLKLYSTDANNPNYPGIDFDTVHNQGVSLECNIFDTDLPVDGYGLILKESASNTQFPSTGVLSLSVLGNIYAGGTTLAGLSRVLTTADQTKSNIDALGINADQLDGQEGSYYLDTSSTAQTKSGDLLLSSDLKVSGDIEIGGATYSEVSELGNRWDYALLDSADKPGFAIDGVGSAYVNSLSTFNGALISQDSEELGNRFAFLQLDSSNIPAYGVDTEGVFYVNSIKTFAGLNNSIGISDTDEVSEGSVNLYYTDSRARAAITAQEEAGLDYDSSTGELKSIDGDANRVIVKWGDSVSADVLNTELLAQLDPGREMLSRSTGGIDNGSILARFGALPITGRCYWEVKTVTVVSHTGAVVTLSSGNTTDIEVGDYFRGSGQHIDTVITDIDTVNETITLCIDASSDSSSGSLPTTANSYSIQRPKIEAGKQTRIEHFAPTTIHNQTSTGVLSHIFIKGLKGVPYPSSTNLPRDFNVSNNSTSSDWSSEIAKFTAENFISTAPVVVRDTTITSGGTAGSATIVVADSSDIKPGDSVMARGISYLTHVFDVDYSTNTVKLTKDCEFTVTGNVRFYERLKVAPDVTQSISNREVQLKHCINIFDFDEGSVPENSRPYWWPNVHHTPHKNYGYEDTIAQYKAFADTQKHPMGKWLITSYQVWKDMYQNPDGTATSAWTNRRDHARWASELYPENFFDLARHVWTEAEGWYQANYLELYQHGWEKTFIEMGTGAISGAPTSGTYTNGDPLLDGDMWKDNSSGADVRYVLLLTTGDATHDAAQQSEFGGTHTIPTTTGQGIWITLSSYSTLTGSGSLYSNWATTRQLTHNGVTYQGSALDIFRKSSPRIGKRDSAHSNSLGKKLLGYLIGQELLRRGW